MTDSKSLALVAGAVALFLPPLIVPEVFEQILNGIAVFTVTLVVLFVLIRSRRFRLLVRSQQRSKIWKVAIGTGATVYLLQLLRLL